MRTTFLFLFILVLLGCSSQKEKTEQLALWPNGITYEIFIQSYCDSNGDGIGDIPGLTQKLDYLKNLGIEAIWLMPFNPSPSYHKYDVTDYYGIHPDYGTMDDFRGMVAAAHDRGIKIIMDLVINHTSKDHPWFQEASSDTSSRYRDYYIWKTDEEIEKESSRIKDVTGDSDNIYQWHDAEGNDQKYYGFFWGGMPDLNFDNPEVRKEIVEIGEFWLADVGVDGFRLDAARHIYTEDRAEDSQDWWVYFRGQMAKAKPDVYLVGEVWGKSEEVAPYLRGLPALFNFELGWGIVDAVNNHDKGDLILNQEEILTSYDSVAMGDYTDATFLRNHDQNRIRSEVGGNLAQAKLAASILFTLPGSPYIYYGEEIGMLGKKPDENIREPFLWGSASEDDCRATWIDPEYSVEEKVTPLSLQVEDPNSIYNHYRSLIDYRRSSEILTLGELDRLPSEAEDVLAFTRAYQGHSIQIFHSLSGESRKLPEWTKEAEVDFSTGGFKNGKLAGYHSVAFRVL